MQFPVLLDDQLQKRVLRTPLAIAFNQCSSGIDHEIYHVTTPPVQKMVWLDDNEERKRILMDLRVMTSHRSPHIVQYYGSAIWNVSIFRRAHSNVSV